MDLFTDWTRAEPRYFYFRGLMFGFIATTFLWVFIVPAWRKLANALKNKG